MMHALHAETSTSLRISILAEPPAQDFIKAHAATLDAAFQTVPMSETMRQRLQRSDYIFSGIKTFHELKEAFPSLIDENGNRKSFERFLNDVRVIDQTYNANYLRAEYNFVANSATMAAKWERFAADGDRYHLQYRTAADDRVRPEHAALHGVTLPPSDAFWEEYYPPNGWGCRCNVVQVIPDKYPATPHDEAMALGEAATGNDKRGIFHFNSGIQGKTVPDYNPYTISRCRTCPVANTDNKLSRMSPYHGDQTALAASIPQPELCAACRLIHNQAKERPAEEVTRRRIKAAQKELVNWYKQNLRPAKAGKFDAKRILVKDKKGIEIIVSRTFYSEAINKYKADQLYPIKLQYAKQAHELLKTAKLVNAAEPSNDHPDSTFRVYEYIDDCYKVELKVKCNRDGNLLYYIRVYRQ